MTESIIAIIVAAAPVLIQLGQLAGLLAKVHTRNLTVDEVEVEIKKIMTRRESQDAEENAAIPR